MAILTNTIKIHVVKCQILINLSVELEESNCIPTSMWNVYTQQRWVRMQVNVCTCNSHISREFIVCGNLIRICRDCCF